MANWQVYEATGGSGTSTVSVPPGVAVVGIAAYAAAGVTTATVEAPAGSGTIGIPAGGAVELSPPILPDTQVPTMIGPVDIRFVNTSGFIVETLT